MKHRWMRDLHWGTPLRLRGYAASRSALTLGEQLVEAQQSGINWWSTHIYIYRYMYIYVYIYIFVLYKYNIILLVPPFSPFFSDPDVATSAFFSAVDAVTTRPPRAPRAPWVRPWDESIHGLMIGRLGPGCGTGCFTGVSRVKGEALSSQVGWSKLVHLG